MKPHDKKEPFFNKDDIFNMSVQFLLQLLFIGVFILTVYSLANKVVAIREKAEQTITTTVTLKSATYQNATAGTFTLGFGTIKNSNYYVCYEELPDGGLKLIKFDAENTTIYETLDEETAYAEITEDGNGQQKGIKLYVPQNTIQQEYNLNT